MSDLPKGTRLTIDPYKDALYFFCPCSPEQAAAWCKKKKIELDLEGYETMDAVTYYSNCGNIVFMQKFEPTPARIAILAHELVHVTFNTLHAKGVKEEAGHEEAAAYLLDSLMERCLKWIIRSEKKASETQVARD
jgi:hypothetical protein